MFHLFYWGGVRNEGRAAKFLSTDQQDFWFETAANRKEFRERLETFADQNNRIVCFTETNSDTRTVAVMVFQYKGQKYPLEYDFGVGYEERMARFMFEDGNYSCDCNRATFLSEKFQVFNDVDGCGEEIEMLSFHCEYHPVGVPVKME